MNDLGTPSIADLFHIFYNLNRSITWELNTLSNRLQKQLNKAIENNLSSQSIDNIINSISKLKQSRLIYDDACYNLSLAVHPFELNNQTISTTKLVKEKLTDIFKTMKTIKKTHTLNDRIDSLRTFKNQIPSLSCLIDIWWSWVDQSLIYYNSNTSVVNWVKQYLLPTVYWKQQIKRTKNSRLRENYQSAYQLSISVFQQHSLTLSLTPLEQEKWWNWAVWMVTKFQRASSAVEGRNGYLSQIHHSRRGLSIKRLQVSTQIHNFYLRRSDDTTAAQRLFGYQFPDLFDYLVEEIQELPQPRKSRKSSKPQTFSIPIVPS